MHNTDDSSFFKPTNSNLTIGMHTRLVSMRLKAESKTDPLNTGMFLWTARAKNRSDSRRTWRMARQHWFSFGSDMYESAPQVVAGDPLAMLNAFNWRGEQSLEVVDTEWQAAPTKMLASYAGGYWLADLKHRPLILIEDRQRRLRQAG